MPEHDRVAPPSRRAVLFGAGTLSAGMAVAGCSTTDTTGDEAAGDTATVGAAPGTALGPASEVPVGSAKIYTTQGVVVTQATAGSFAAFSTVCPHQGCALATVQGADIMCPCHGSTFTLDGSVVTGPATTGLQSLGVTLTGDEITLA